MKRITLLLLFFGLLTAAFASPTGNTIPLDSAVNNILKQVLLFPQEKLYLQTDKPYYISGEKVFFRAFLLNAFSHTPSDMSRYVYVELINEQDSVKIRQQIRPDEKNNLHYGALSLPEDLPQGTYQIRAYTRFMENTGEDYFFSRTVFVADPSLLKEDKAEGKEKEKTKAADSQPLKFDVSFYPEGGNLIDGQLCNVAFKALAADGNPVDIQGELLDSQHNKITAFTTVHDGMGRFTFRPEYGKKYHAVCKYDDRSMQVNLPEVNNTFALSAAWRQNKLWITVNKSVNSPEQKLYLLVHTGGMTLYSGEWDWATGLLAIEKTDFPSGVSHLLLLTEDYQPVSERLVFALNNDWITPEIQSDKNRYKSRELVKLTVDCREDLFGNLSIAIIDDKDIQSDTALHILSRILLTSELKGYIPNPAYYFRAGNREAEQAADLLMMTHGWNRYDIPRAMRGDYQLLTVANEEAQSFAGMVKGGLLSKPYEGAPVTIISTHSSFFDSTITDKDGRFVFRDFEFADSTTYVIQALTKKKKDVVELYLDPLTFPKPRTIGLFKKRDKQMVIEIEEDKYSDYVAKADLKYTYENGRRMIYLPEVSVRAGRPHQSPYYLEPDASLSEREIRMSGDIHILFSKVPNLKITGEVLRFRSHGNPGYINSPPMIMVDGQIMCYGDNETDDASIDFLALNFLKLLFIEDIEQVDFIRTPAKLGAYGVQGKNGVIEIFTKKGYWDNSKLHFNIQQITPLGYQKPVEFYSPQYDNPEARNNPIPDLRSTIYWKPDVVLNAEGKTTVEFYTADASTTYSVIMEGITLEGKLIYNRQRAMISIEEK